MYKILFVDDDVDTAKEHAEQVELFTKVRAIVCGTRQQALDAVQRYPIAVAVLDQVMPEISGTALLDELRRIVPQLRAVMLSGEAKETDYDEAAKLGYRRYIHKSRSHELPGAVLQQLIGHQTEINKGLQFESLFLFAVKKWLGIRGSLEFWLEGIYIEEETFIPGNEWQLTDQINLGEKKTVKELYDLRIELQFEQSIENEMSADAEIAVKAGFELKQKLHSSLKTKLGGRQVLEQRKTKEVTRELSLAPEPADLNQEFVRSRSFYWAPTYVKVAVHISKRIRPFNERQMIYVTALIPKSEIATKQRDVLNSGQVREIVTDIYRI